jgi:hypothetical protein
VFHLILACLGTSSERYQRCSHRRCSHRFTNCYLKRVLTKKSSFHTELHDNPTVYSTDLSLKQTVRCRDESCRIPFLKKCRDIITILEALLLCCLIILKAVRLVELENRVFNSCPQICSKHLFFSDKYVAIYTRNVWRNALRTSCKVRVIVVIF